MSDGFRDYFVGEKGYDALKKLMRNGNDQCTDLAKCLQERSDAEVAYARVLAKNSDALQKMASRAKGTHAQAFIALATQTSKESEAHSLIAGVLANDISIPIKNLAESQYKDRKSIEEVLNGKFKEWNSQKVIDNKYRTRQFDKCKEIETLINKISDSSTATKSSAKSKTSSLSSPLVLGCVRPTGRHMSASEKMEQSIQKAEQELVRTEEKYHNSTRDVELARQACDTQMRRSCELLQKMEFDRITELTNYINIYNKSIETLSDTMFQITQDLKAIQISSNNDIIALARSNTESTEIGILLYDIYAEDERTTMSKERRIISLMNWIKTLKKDIDTQERSKTINYSSPLPKSVEEESPDDDRGSSDGAMCSTSSRSKKDIVMNADRRDSSSSSSNDDDGAMKHAKREKRKNKQGVEGFSSGIFSDRRSVFLLQELYKASLYKIESVYNKLKNLRELQYEHEQRLTKTFNDKGCPTTYLRLPNRSSAYTPPSAPPVTKLFFEASPMFVQPLRQQQQMVYPLQTQAPPPAPGWIAQNEQTASDNRMEASAPPCPVLMTRSMVEMPQENPVKFVRALYSYQAQHRDELNFEPGDNIMLIERRKDKWCKGNLNGKTGLFPGNYVEDA